MTDKLQVIRDKVIAANPSVEQRFCCKYSTVKKEDFCDSCLSTSRTLRLADVLLAMGCNAPEDIYQVDGLAEEVQTIISYYNLRHDDLSLQSTKTIDFLYDLLTKQ